MSVQQKVALISILTVIVCGTILYVFLFIALWPFREWVGISLLGLAILCVVIWLRVWSRGRITEQDVRRERFRYHEEIPLDVIGEPLYWPNGAQPNPHRRHQPVPVPYAHSYQQYEQPYEGGYRG